MMPLQVDQTIILVFKKFLFCFKNIKFFFLDFAQANPKLVYRPGDEKAKNKTNIEVYYQPVRQMDADILWLKTKPLKAK